MKQKETTNNKISVHDFLTKERENNFPRLRKYGVFYKKEQLRWEALYPTITSFKEIYDFIDTLPRDSLRYKLRVYRRRNLRIGDYPYFLMTKTQFKNYIDQLQNEYNSIH